jgi:hypothetical protein
MGGPIGPRLIGHLCVQNCRGRHQKQMQCHASHNFINKCPTRLALPSHFAEAPNSFKRSSLSGGAGSAADDGIHRIGRTGSSTEAAQDTSRFER